MENLNENVNQNQTQGENVETKVSIDKEELFAMLDNVVAKRTEGITKNILKENGIENDEIKAFMADYKTYKASKSSNKDKELEDLKILNGQLLNTIKSNEKNVAFSKVAGKLGITSENLVYVEKLADSTNFEKDGHFDEVEIENAFLKVLEQVPGLRGKTENTDNGFVKIGGAKQEAQNELMTENRMRKIFGLPEITK